MTTTARTKENGFDFPLFKTPLRTPGELLQIKFDWKKIFVLEFFSTEWYVIIGYIE
jgi:hypothetical protein